MRVAFLGTPEFAVPSLELLIRDPACDVVGVFTQPDRKAGRGMLLAPPPVKWVAREYDVPCFQYQSLRKTPEALEVLKSLQPDLGVVVAFGQILVRDFFEFPRLGTLNVHASILPAYRGAAPVAHALLNGEEVTGVTIMRIDEGMDTGDLLSSRRIPVDREMTTGELEAVLAMTGAELLLETIGGYAGGSLLPRPQDHTLATCAPRIRREDGRIDWTRGAPVLHNQVRAMNPWPGAFFQWRDQEVKLWRTFAPDEGEVIDAPPGAVVSADSKGLVVVCGKGTVLRLRELQLLSRKRVSARDFVNGTQIRSGEFFTSRP